MIAKFRSFDEVGFKNLLRERFRNYRNQKPRK